MTVINDFGVNGLFPSVVGGTGATVKYFPRLLGTSIGVQSVAPSATNAAGQLVPNGISILNGQNFNVLVGGNVTSGVSDSSVTIEAALYANTGSVAAPVYVKLATTGAVTAPLANTSFNFNLYVELFGTTASGVVRGWQRSIMGTTQNTLAALTNNLSGINFNSNVGTIPASSTGGTGTAGGNATPFGLVVGVTFGSSDAGNLANLNQFQVVGS
jgi:hypothetical protein